MQKWIQKETEWIFQTDQKQLFDETIEVLNNVGNIEIEFFDSAPYSMTTKWEDAKIADNYIINRMRFHFL